MFILYFYIGIMKKLSNLFGLLLIILSACTNTEIETTDTNNYSFVTQLGDCAQSGNVTAEYDIAHAAYLTLETATDVDYPDGIPYGIAVGNHDQSPIANPGSIPTVGDVNHAERGIAQ